MVTRDEMSHQVSKKMRSVTTPTWTTKHVSVGEREEDGGMDGDGLALGDGDGAADGVCVGAGCAQPPTSKEYAPVKFATSRFRLESR
mmetsp:Transcript_31276/g.66559  ORF Transcript_31276/g.66559 Transcript_31276/m.66559 type:complete len:87 (+) Transcript_31276:391-651(+)